MKLRKSVFTIFLLCIYLISQCEGSSEIYEGQPSYMAFENLESREFYFKTSITGSERKISILTTPILNKANCGRANYNISYFDSTLNKSLVQSCYSQHIFFSIPCLITLPDLPIGSEVLLNITAQCVEASDGCALSFKIHHEHEVFIKNHLPQLYAFDREESEIFKFFVSGDKEIKRFILSIYFKNLEAGSTYESKQNVPTETIFFNYGKPQLIHSGYRILAIFDAADTSLCRNCNVSLYLTSTRGIIIELAYFEYAEKTTLRVETEYYDYITSDKNPNFYDFDLLKFQSDLLKAENSSQKIVFSLASISGGEKTLYLNMDTLPYLLNNYQYNSTLKNYYNEEDIIISSSEIAAMKAQAIKFYAAILGVSPGAYKIEAKIVDTPMIKLIMGVVEDRIIKQDEVHNYELELWRSEGIVTVKLAIERGNVDLFARLCDIEEKCEPITLDNIINNTKIDYKSESEGNDHLKISSKCPDNDLFCYLVIAVRGYALGTNSNRYSLLASTETGLITLLENVKHESHIELGAQNEYKLFVDDSNNDVEYISIKITSELLMDVTVNNECLQRLNECHTTRGDSRHPVVFTKDENTTLTANYYIIVSALKSSNYFIIPTVKRKNSNTPVIKLSEGKFHKEILNSKNKKAYFQFHVHIEFNTYVDISIQGDKNKFIMYVCDDDTNPSETHNIISSSTNFVRLDHFNEVPEKIYKVMVTALDDKIFENDPNLEFSIVYGTTLTISTLEKNQIFHSSIDPEIMKYFVFIIDSREIFHITKNVISPTSITDNLEFFISAFPYPSLYSFDHKVVSHGDDKLSLTADEIKKACGDTNPHCPIYLTVHNQNKTTPIIFSILVQMEMFAVQLFEGMEQKFIMSPLEKVFKAYYIPYSFNKTIDLFFYSLKEPFELYIKIKNDKSHHINTPFYDFNPENLSLFELKYVKQNRHSISLRPTHFDNCQPNCVVIIEMSFNRNEFNNEKFPIFAIISSEMLEIFEGKPLMFNLDKYQIKYFSFDLTNELKETNDLTISLSLTSYYGEGEMYINLNHDYFETRPEPQEYQYISYMNHFEATKFQLFSKLKSDYLMKLKNIRLTIGVIAFNVNSKFLISLQSSKFPLSTLVVGAPMSLSVKSGEFRLFKFFNARSDELKAVFSRESGLGSISIIPCNPLIEETNTLSKCKEKNGTNFKIITGSQTSFLKVNEKTTENFCKYCNYIVKITSVTDLKGSIFISDKDSFISLQEGKKIYDILENDECSKYELIAEDVEEIELLITVIYGNPTLHFSYEFSKDKNEYPIHTKRNDSNFVYLRIPARRKEKSDTEPEVFNTYYVIVSADERAEYYISYLSTKHQILSSGLLNMDTLQGGKRKFYIFHNKESEADLIFTVKTMTNDIDNIDIDMMIDHKDPTKLHESENMVITLNLEPSFKSNNTISYKLLNQTGVYYFLLDSRVSYDINYTVVVSGRDVTLFPYDFTLQNFMESGRTNFYEMYIPRKGYLVLEMNQCYGETDLFMTQDYSKLLKEDFQEGFKPVEGQSTINSIRVDKGIFYLVLKSGDKLSIFDLNSHFYDIYNEIPQYRLTIANQLKEQSAYYSYHRGEKKFDLLINPVKCRDCSKKELESTNVTYYIMGGEDEKSLEAASKCGLVYIRGTENFTVSKVNHFNEKIFSHKLAEGNATEFLKFDVKMNIPIGGFYFVTIRAVVDSLGGSKNITLFYPTLQVYVNTSESATSLAMDYLVTIVVVAVVIFCFLFGIYFYGKYRKIQKKLLYAVEDANVNDISVTGVNTFDHLNQSIEMENKKYQGLQDA